MVAASGSLVLTAILTATGIRGWSFGPKCRVNLVRSIPHDFGKDVAINVQCCTNVAVTQNLHDGFGSNSLGQW